MALIKCPECSRQVSDKAPACPQCGYPVAQALSRAIPQAVAATTSKSQRPEAQPPVIDSPAPLKDSLRPAAVPRVSPLVQSGSGSKTPLPQPPCQTPNTGRASLAATACRDGDGEREKDELREIALRQRFLCYAILIYLVTFVPLFIMVSIPSLVVLALLGDLANTGLQIWCVFKLGRALKLPLAWLWAATMFMPCIKLGFLFIINGRASSLLRKAGLRIGLLGADPNST